MEFKGELSELKDKFLFPKIFQTFKMAIQPSKLIIGFFAIAVICLSGWIMDFHKTVIVSRTGYSELQIYMLDPGGMHQFIERHKDSTSCKGVFATLWHTTASRFHDSLISLSELNFAAVKTNIIYCFKAFQWAFRYHFLFCLIFVIITLSVISIAGGGLCRIAALQLARDEKPGFVEALRFGTRHFWSFFGSVLIPVLIITLIGLSLFILGLITNIPAVGELIMAVFLPLALIAGSIITALLIGTAAGLNLMFPAVAYNGSDCFDSMSHSFNYVYSRPWRMIFYTLTTAVYGALCYVFVRFFAFLLLWLTRRFILLGVFATNDSGMNKLKALWSEPHFLNLYSSSGLSASGLPQNIAAFLVHVFSLVVMCLLISFLISFYFSANTVIYSLLRNREEGISIDEVYTEFDDNGMESTAIEPKPEKAKALPKSKKRANSPKKQKKTGKNKSNL